MAPSDSEPFTLVTTQSCNSLYLDYADFLSAKVADVDVQIAKALREHYPELCVTVVPLRSAPLLDFAAAGFATATLDDKTESVVRWRGFVPSEHRGGTGQLGDAIFFAKYHYKWSDADFILYTVANGPSIIQYILKEPDSTKGEHTLSNCAVTDALISACAIASLGDETDFVYVYDDYWTRSRTLWEEVQRASWDDVILDPNMKKALTNVTKNFFDSKELYKRYGVPWKRGLIFYGPPGNGKTISIKALMKELSLRKSNPIPTLYVKNAPYTYDIGEVFSFARTMTPCLLVLEDVETIVTQNTRSYFFNEVDGLGNNDGILMVASTNYLDRLDSGLSRRPSRFDRKYNFELPNRSERTEYAQYWRQKLAKSNPSIDFPSKLCPAIAKITQQFSFAYMQEAFIASLLMLAREDQDDEGGQEILADYALEKEEYNSPARNLFQNILQGADEEDDTLKKNKLWRAMKTNVKMLRKDLENHNDDPEDDDNLEIDHVGRHAREPSIKSEQLSYRYRYLDAAGSTQRLPRELPDRSVKSDNVGRTQRNPASMQWRPRRSSQSFSQTVDAAGARNLSNRETSEIIERTNPWSPFKMPLNPRMVTALPRDNIAQATERTRGTEPSQDEMADAGIVKRKYFAETAYERN